MKLYIVSCASVHDWPDCTRPEVLMDRELAAHAWRDEFIKDESKDELEWVCYNNAPTDEMITHKLYVVLVPNLSRTVEPKKERPYAPGEKEEIERKKLEKFAQHLKENK